jgi:hypothetical protein
MKAEKARAQTFTKRAPKGLSFLLLFFTAALLHPQVPVALSHFGEVTDLVYDANRGLLFSAGADGTVRIWNADEKKLLQVVRVSHRPVRQLAVHPTRSHIAVLVGDELQVDSLEVWDWENQRRLFAVQADKQLMYFAYSPQGNYLFYSQADYKSLTALNPRTGRVLPYMGRGFGIVSYFVVARNEGNIMTYQPSGFITYWDIRTGRTVKQVRAPANLEVMCISPNNRYLAASTDRDLLVVDLLSGEIVDSLRVAGIVDLAFSPEGNEIAGIVEGASARTVKRWYFGGQYLIGLTSAYEGRFPSLNCLVYGDQDLYLASGNGSIWRVGRDAEVGLIVSDRRSGVSDIAFSGSTLAIATTERISIIDSEFLLPSYEIGEDVAVRESRFRNPFASGIGMAYLDARRLLLWRKGGQEGELAVLNTWYGGIQQLPASFTSPIRQVWVSEQGIVVVEESGRCRILDPATFSTTFEYNAPGMNKLIFTFGDTLIGAKTSLSSFSGPLLQINRRTGETVPIQDPSLFVYDILYSGAERGSDLYTLGVEQGSTQVRTVVRVHTGFAFERSRVLKTFDGEDPGATLAGDDGGQLFTSLGYETVTVFRGGQAGVMEPSGQVPRRLYVHNGKVFSLNRDYSISVWEIRSRRLLLTIHLFDDGTWAAVRPDGAVRLSREEDLY